MPDATLVSISQTWWGKLACDRQHVEHGEAEACMHRQDLRINAIIFCGVRWACVWAGRRKVEEATPAEEPEGETAEHSAEAAAACLRFAACVSDQHKSS